MINKVVNECNISGKLYGFGRFGLEEKDGKIRGSVMVLTDGPTQNIVEVNFIPQAPKYKSGKDNNNYKVLKQIIDEELTVEKVGERAACSVRIASNLTVNTYYRKTEQNEYVLSETPQVRGNFIHIDSKAQPDASFNIDCLIQDMVDEVNTQGEETGNKIFKVRVFDDYRKMFFPLQFVMKLPEGIDFATTNYEPGSSYVNLSGRIINKTLEPVQSNADMGFGQHAQMGQPRTIREYEITGGTVPRELPMTDDEVKEVKLNRDNFLTETKNRAMERANSKSTKSFESGLQSSFKKETVSTGSKTYDF